jgi:cathepsin D
MEKNWFSFYITGEDEENKSQIILGEPSSDFYQGRLTWHKVSEESYWQVEMKDIHLGAGPTGICREPCKLVFDTGTSIITGPTQDLKSLTDLIQLDNCNEISSLPDLGFEIGDSIYTLKPSEYILTPSHRSSLLEVSKNESTAKVMKVKEKAEFFLGFNKMESSFENENTSYKHKTKMPCRKAFMPLDVDPPRGPLWVVGDIFLRKYFVVFDRDEKRIGIALRKRRIR